MFEKYKPGIIFFSICALIAIIFPPVVCQWRRSIKKSFGFFLSFPKKDGGWSGSINFEQLILEIAVIFILTVIFQVNYEKIKKWIKSNTSI